MAYSDVLAKTLSERRDRDIVKDIPDDRSISGTPGGSYNPASNPNYRAAIQTPSAVLSYYKKAAAAAAAAAAQQIEDRQNLVNSSATHRALANSAKAVGTHYSFVDSGQGVPVSVYQSGKPINRAAEQVPYGLDNLSKGGPDYPVVDASNISGYTLNDALSTTKSYLDNYMRTNNIKTDYNSITDELMRAISDAENRMRGYASTQNDYQELLNYRNLGNIITALRKARQSGVTSNAGANQQAARELQAITSTEQTNREAIDALRQDQLEKFYTIANLRAQVPKEANTIASTYSDQINNLLSSVSAAYNNNYAGYLAQAQGGIEQARINAEANLKAQQLANEASLYPYSEAGLNAARQQAVDNYMISLGFDPVTGKQLKPSNTSGKTDYNELSDEQKARYNDLIEQYGTPSKANNKAASAKAGATALGLLNGVTLFLPDLITKLNTGDASATVASKNYQASLDQMISDIDFLNSVSNDYGLTTPYYIPEILNDYYKKSKSNK